MWEDATRGGVREVLLLSAAEGQVGTGLQLCCTVPYVMLYAAL